MIVTIIIIIIVIIIIMIIIIIIIIVFVIIIIIIITIITIKLEIVNINTCPMFFAGMILSDMSVPGCPIVHLNQGFTNMTGYGNEKLGTNCKFLQVCTVRTDRIQSPN